MWELVYELLYQKNLQISTLSHEQIMHSQRIARLCTVLIHLYKCSGIELDT